jgi:hypothetical protein
METESSTPTTGGESTLDRLESFLSADTDPKEPSEPQPEAKQADESAPEPEAVDDKDSDSEPPNEYQLADVAKLLGADESSLDVDEDGSITVKTKIDGESGKVKFADLIKSYQLQGHVDKQVREAAEARKAAQDYVQQAQQQVQVQQAVVEKIAEAKVIETQLAQYQGINWSALEDSDPVQAMRLQRQFGELKQAYQSKVQEVNQAQTYIQQQQSQNTAASLESERQALAKACPEWSSEAVATKEKQAIAADLLSRGYSQADIQGLSDHKAVLLARDAMLYRQMKAQNTTAEKQVRQAPKIIKPGSSAPRNTNAAQKLHQEVKRTGSRQSVMDYLLSTGKV